MSDKSKPEENTADNWVTFVEDPYGIHTREVALEQELEEPIEEGMSAGTESPETDVTTLQTAAEAWATDGVPEAEAGQLEQIAQAMKTEEAKLERKVGIMDATEAQAMATRLAREIAEDQALAQEMTKEAQAPSAALSSDEDNPASSLNVLDVAEVASGIETLLFLADKPVSRAKLREHLGAECPLSLFENALDFLKEMYAATHHGIELQEIAGGLQLRTKPGRADLARKLAKVQTQKLSSGAMETLAIVAFRQPLLKDEIDKIRGVDSSYFVRGLLERKLIQITGRSELPGRPMVYTTTPYFLELFGLKDLSALPSLRELEQMVPASEAQNEKDEDPRVLQMRKLVGQMNDDPSTGLAYNPREDEALLREIRERVGSIVTSTPTLEALDHPADVTDAPAVVAEPGDEALAAAEAMGLELPQAD